MATHSSILAWTIQWTEESGGLQSRITKNQTGLSEHAHVPALRELAMGGTHALLKVTGHLCS